MLEWISYPRKDVKRVREAGNGLKSNSTTDHRGVHKENLSVSQNMLFGRRFDSAQVHKRGRLSQVIFELAYRFVKVPLYYPGLNGFDGSGK